MLLIPGFMAGDGTLATMAKWLRANGYWTHRSGHPGQRRLLAGRLRADRGAARGARRAHRLQGGDRRPEPRRRPGARGGAAAPDLVSGIVGLGAPTVGQLRVHPLVLLQVGVVGALGTGRVPGLVPA